MKLLISGKSVRSNSYHPFTIYDEKKNMKYYLKLTGPSWSGFFVYDQDDTLVGSVRKNKFPLGLNLLGGNGRIKQQTEILLGNQPMGSIIYEPGGRGFLRPDIKVDYMGWSVMGQTNAWKYYIIGSAGQGTIAHIFQEDNDFLGQKSVAIEFNDPGNEQMVVLLIAGLYLMWSTYTAN